MSFRRPPRSHARCSDFVQRFAPLLGDNSRPARKAYLRGLLLDNGNTKTAEAIALKVHGDPSQVRMTQVFLGQSAWADEPPREELVRWVDQELGSERGTLIVDESGIPKCGDKSVGVARQYCGATGKIDNCQVAVFLAYASCRRAHAVGRAVVSAGGRMGQGCRTKGGRRARRRRLPHQAGVGLGADPKRRAAGSAMAG